MVEAVLNIKNGVTVWVFACLPQWHGKRASM